jgi:integrase
MKQPRLKFDQKLKRYYARIQIGGIRRRIWLGSNEKKAARELADKLKSIAAGTLVFSTAASTATVGADGRKDMRLEELAHLHLQWVKTNRSARSYTLRSYAINALLKFMGPSMVSDITRLKLSQFYDYARSMHSRRNNGGNHYYREVKTMLLWAEDYEVCDLPVKHFPPMRHTPPRTLRFTDEEITKLLACIPECDFRDMLLFGLMTGLRPNEMRTLKKSEIMDDGHGHSYVLIEVHKTSRSARDPQPRTVPLTKEACEIVKRQCAANPKSEFVFLNEAATPYDSAGFRHKLERWCRRAKIDRKPPYALRHTFASMQADGDTNMVALGQLMGHSSTRTTARYIRVSCEHHLKAVEKGAEHILALMKNGAEVAKTESEGSQNVATKVATNPNLENKTGDCIAATACELTT